MHYQQKKIAVSMQFFLKKLPKNPEKMFKYKLYIALK